MKKKVLLTSLLALAMAAVLGLTACGGQQTKADEEKTNIKIGIRADLVDLLEAATPAIQEAGFTIETVVFDDSVQPNVALAEGSIDINWFQHEPYLNSYNKSNGTTFKMVQPKSYWPLFAMYSSKIKDVKDLKDGATIGLCNDASNQARGLKLLADQGLITLDPEAATPTVLDVKENPKNLKFIEAEMSVLPQSIKDVDAICLAATHMVNAGKDADSYVVKSNDAEEYGVGFVVTEENADAAWAKKLAEAVQCDALADTLATAKKGTMLPTWK